MVSRLIVACCELRVIMLCILMAIILTLTLSGDIVSCNVMCSSESSMIDSRWVTLIALVHIAGTHGSSLSEVELFYSGQLQALVSSVWLKVEFPCNGCKWTHCASTQHCLNMKMV